MVCVGGVKNRTVNYFGAIEFNPVQSRKSPIQTLPCRFVHRNLIRQRTTLLWFASGFVLEATDTELQRLLPNMQRFLPNAPQFGERATFSRLKVPQSLDCGALQDGALRLGHQSAAHTVGEKWHTWRCVFKYRGSTFVVFFLTYTVAFYLKTFLRRNPSLSPYQFPTFFPLPPSPPYPPPLFLPPPPPSFPPSPLPPVPPVPPVPPLPSPPSPSPSPPPLPLPSSSPPPLPLLTPSHPYRW